MGAHQKRQEQDDVLDGEIIAEYDGTMMNLPTIRGKQSGRPGQEGPDPERRQFIIRLLLGGASALALGGSAALVYDRHRNNQESVVVLPEGSEISAEDVAALLEQISSLDYQLASVTAERDQLIADLNTSQADAANAQAQLADALRLIDDYRVLLSLWQQLDDVGIDGLLAIALGVASGSFSRMMEVVEILRTGVAAARAVIDWFIARLPGPQQGIAWLQGQVSLFSANLEWLGDQMEEALDPVEPLTSMVAQFVIWVLDRLPFGIGSKARAGMEALREIVNDIPNLLTGIGTSILDPLADWFGNNRSTNMFGILLDPIDDHVMLPASDVFKQVTGFADVFDNNLVAPTEQALAERSQIRQQIQETQARLGLRV
nr:hypothetical protein [Anaerolineae bacterium]